MSDTKDTDVKEQEHVEENVEEKGDVDVSENPETLDQNEENSMPPPEEEVIFLLHILLVDTVNKMVLSSGSLTIALIYF